MSARNVQLENLAERDGSGWRITGPISAAPVSPLYKVGLGAVALVMVLLPLFYVGFIALVAYAVYRHALNPWYSLGGGWVGLLGYVAPIIIGTILVFFMIKPFFARRSRTTQSPRLEPYQEPELFRFVHAICDLVKAPRPRCIQLGTQWQLRSTRPLRKIAVLRSGSVHCSTSERVGRLNRRKRFQQLTLHPSMSKSSS